jgi:electron transport complex protein RnfD
MNGSPFALLANNSVTAVMFKVMAALIPGIIAHAWFFGPGIWVSLLLCTVFAIGVEALILLMRGLPLKPFLSDGSVLVTAWLLALSLPTLAPWWLYAVGIASSPCWWPSNSTAAWARTCSTRPWWATPP